MADLLDFVDVELCSEGKCRFLFSNFTCNKQNPGASLGRSTIVATMQVAEFSVIIANGVSQIKSP